VQVGDIRNGLRVIKSGLVPDDRVIIDGLPYAKPGSKVDAQGGTIQYAAKGQE
jgi:membrane fusion protein, multidrug efflux system